MLHVHGGSVLLEQLRAAGIAGEFLEWVDVLCRGPTPAAVTPREWRHLRARFLDEAFGVAEDEAYRRAAAQDAALERGLAEHDEVVLWFSADWFCQAILLSLLARLDDRATSPLPRQGEGDRGRGWRERDAASGAAVSLVCIGEHPGVAERSCVLAFLSAEQLRDQLRARVPVTPDHTKLARRAWDALCAPSPVAIVDLRREPMPLLPFAREGLARHLRELPATGSGLSLTERNVLMELAKRPRSAMDLFPAVAGREERQWITDTIFVDVLRHLAAGSAPLVTLDPPDALRPCTADGLRRTQVTITETGHDVLEGRSDWIALAGIDRWVGGVHLTSDRVWRWDEASGGVISAPPTPRP
jgi:hypothetical protein